MPNRNYVILLLEMNEENNSNVYGELPLFVSQAHGSETYTYVTQCNGKARGYIRNWEVTEDNASDHQLIIFEISTDDEDAT
ncbi:hypothetical protein PR048_001900 [Dryococelus australis]|uniref:Uncharacterized protein n=1 Tax=Dryococelus australis TaxID=614101 RepID=A0ABQ9IJR0_9NEOP|nr:hypothetical protein PR048_001900 [Dryococelus australis]